MHIGIADIGTAVLEGVVVVRGRFDDEPLELAPVGSVEDRIVDRIVVSGLVLGDVVEAALAIRPRVVTMLVELARGFIAEQPVRPEILKGAVG